LMPLNIIARLGKLQENSGMYLENTDSKNQSTRT